MIAARRIWVTVSRKLAAFASGAMVRESGMSRRSFCRVSTVASAQSHQHVASEQEAMRERVGGVQVVLRGPGDPGPSGDLRDDGRAARDLGCPVDPADK